MEKIKAIIVEDEELGRTLIKNFLQDFPDIELIDECVDGFNGAVAINDKQPDLVFLDIQMPKLNGFEMLELLNYEPEIIFTTAYNEYAIKAFELNAVDYLLKPFSKERMGTAIEKAVQKIENKQPSKEKIRELVNQPITEHIERVVVKSGTRINVIPVTKISYFEAQDDYVMLYTSEGKHLKQATMKYFEDHLNPDDFVRVHRSYIVRIDQVAQLQPYEKGSYVAILKSGDKLKVSKSGLKNLKERLNF
ncbi:MAG: response regulator [Bacteroidetes bacterium]|jgi:two-component system LytT family response regulator|nr:response regulator [Bacteroidota bacterium]